MDSWSTQSCVGHPVVDRIFLRGMPGVLALCPFFFFYFYFFSFFIQRILLQQRGLWGADSTFVPDLCSRWIIFMPLLINLTLSHRNWQGLSWERAMDSLCQYWKSWMVLPPPHHPSIQHYLSSAHALVVELVFRMSLVFHSHSQSGCHLSFFHCPGSIKCLIQWISIVTTYLCVDTTFVHIGKGQSRGNTSDVCIPN